MPNIATLASGVLAGSVLCEHQSGPDQPHIALGDRFYLLPPQWFYVQAKLRHPTSTAAKGPTRNVCWFSWAAEWLG